MVSTKWSLSRLLEFLGESHRQAWKDIRTRWQRGIFCLLYTGLFVCLGIIHLSPYVPNRAFSNDVPVTACLPDGSFEVDAGPFNYWSSSGFFQITLGFGRLTFTQAKAIDVVWDVIFGRGGQALLGYVSFRIFAMYVTTSMETAPITFHTYRTIFLQQQTFVLDIPRIIRDFTTRLGLNSKIAMVFMIFVMAFILAFPTLGSAMTGYSGNVQSFVPDLEGNFIPFSSFGMAFFVIHDGVRVSPSNGFMVTGENYAMRAFGSSIELSEPTIASLTSVSGYVGDRFLGSEWSNQACASIRNQSVDLADVHSEEWLNQCYLLQNVSSYAATYGLDGGKQINSSFGTMNLDPPILNISAFYLPGFLRGDMTSSKLDNTDSFSDPTRAVWNQAKQTYSFDYVQENGRCQAIENYQWGFSYIQLNLMIYLLIIWKTGIAITWLRAYLIMKKRGREHIAGEHKAVLELSDAMLVQLEEREEGDAKKLLIQTELSIQRQIREDLGGGKISYESALIANGWSAEGDPGFGFLRWLRKEAWWLIYLLTAIAMSIFVGVYGILSYGFAPLTVTLTILVVLSVGSTGRSRGVIYFWGTWLFAALLSVVIVTLTVHGVINPSGIDRTYSYQYYEIEG